jgi:hypothetical protein
VFFILHARLRARRAPGIPCALCSEGRTKEQTSRETRGENAKSYLNVIARSVSDEAIHSFLVRQWIASLTLAMTARLNSIGCLKFENRIPTQAVIIRHRVGATRRPVTDAGG